MADFHLWSKENLVKFAEDAQRRILDLEADLRTVQLAWRKAVASSVSSATVQSQSRFNDLAAAHHARKLAEKLYFTHA